MVLTPSSNSAAIAGIGFWSLVWSSVFKLDTLARWLHLPKRLVSTEKVVGFINRNKIITLLFTEAFNYSVHGISNAISVMFALGGTVTNVLVIFLVMPLVGRRKVTL